MPVRYDSLLTRRLAAEIRHRWRGIRVLSLRTDRDRRRAALELEGGKGSEGGGARGRALVFLLHPEAGHVLASSVVPPGERHAFRDLRLADARAPADERLLYVDLAPGPGEEARFRVVVELHTNQWNLLLVRLPGDTAERVLWPREPGDRVLRPGAEYRPPTGGREGTEGGVSEDRWREILEGVAPEARRGRALREIAWLSSLNVEWVLGEAARGADAGSAVGPDGAEPTGTDPLGAAYLRYRELLALPAGPAGARGTANDEAGGEAWLLPRALGPQPYVHPLGQADAPRLPSLLAATERAAREDGAWERLEETGAPAGEEASAAADRKELEELLDALRERADRLERRRGSLERELGQGPDPEELRQTGNLILARLGQVPRGERRARLEGFDAEPVEVELDPALPPAENAERYFEEASRRERAAERLPGEIRKVEGELEWARAAAGEVEAALGGGAEDPGEGNGGGDEGDDGSPGLSAERIDELWRVAGGRPAEEGPRGEEKRLPYRVLRTSGGLEVRVGRSARDNEELTFHHSHTEDVWLHARQVPGSHVILRWGRKDQNPPRKDLLEAAVAAAVNSQARHSTTVGVDWTRRKYVRSPRKSAPGVVIPQRSDTVFVRPDPEVVKQMQARARAPGEGG